jgi:hypothetical protein
MLRAAVLVFLILQAMGCGEDVVGSSNPSTLHAIASVLEVEDEIGPRVDVRLMVVSTASGSAVFVEDLENVTIDFDGLINPCNDNTLIKDSDGNCVLVMDRQRIRLRAPEGGEAQETFLYDLESRSEARLEYKAGANYSITFTFEGERHNLSVTTPADSNTISKASEEAINKKLEITSGSFFEAGIIEVERLESGDTTFVSYPYSEDFLTSAQDVLDGLDKLDDASGNLLTVPPEAFRREGTHLVTYVGLATSVVGGPGVSDGLGVFSTIIAGSAAQVLTELR